MTIARKIHLAILISESNMVTYANNAMDFIYNTLRSYVSVESTCIPPLWPELQC